MTDQERQDIHDLRGEIGGVRTDIRGLRDEVRAGFERLDGRVRKTEDALVEAWAREDERAKLFSRLRRRASPLHKDPRTYAVSGIGAAIAAILMELMKAFHAAPK